MITGQAAGEAVELARANPRLAVGLHLVLVCGRAALAPAQIPHLVDSEGRFPSRPVRTGLRYQFLPAAREELRREIRAQLEALSQDGARSVPRRRAPAPAHASGRPLDSRRARRGVRHPRRAAPRGESFSRPWPSTAARLVRKLLWSRLFAGLRRHGRRRLKAAGIGFADHVYGLLLSGNVSEDYLLDLLPRVSGEMAEIYCHPDLALAQEPRNGPPGAGPRELDALVSPRVRQLAAKCGFVLTDLPQVIDHLLPWSQFLPIAARAARGGRLPPGIVVLRVHLLCRTRVLRARAGPRHGLPASRDDPQASARRRSRRLRQLRILLPAELSALSVDLRRHRRRRPGDRDCPADRRGLSRTSTSASSSSPRRGAANPKVANLAAMLPEARHATLLISDSDIRVEPTYLATLVQPMADPQRRCRDLPVPLRGHRSGRDARRSGPFHRRPTLRSGRDAAGEAHAQVASIRFGRRRDGLGDPDSQIRPRRDRRLRSDRRLSCGRLPARQPLGEGRLPGRAFPGGRRAPARHAGPGRA